MSYVPPVVNFNSSKPATSSAPVTTVTSETRSFDVVTDIYEENRLGGISYLKAGVASRQFAIGPYVKSASFNPVTNALDLAYAQDANLSAVSTSVSLPDPVVDITAEDGTLTWRFAKPGAQNVKSVSLNSAPVFSAGTLLVGPGSLNNGYVFGVNGSAYVSQTLRVESLEVMGESTTVNPQTTVTSQTLQVDNYGTGPALLIKQFGPEPIAEFFDSDTGAGRVVAIQNDGRFAIGPPVANVAWAANARVHIKDNATPETLRIDTLVDGAFVVNANGVVKIAGALGGANSLEVGGNVTVGKISGSGAGLSALNASNLSSGTVPSACLAVASTTAHGVVQLSSELGTGAAVDDNTQAATVWAASTAYQKALSADAAAATAKLAADTAKTAADTAKSTADAAQLSASTASSTAASALTTASTASTTAAAANTTANTAKSTADAAQLVASTASSTAAGALTAATNANTAAQSALTTAQNANTTAQSALTTAQGALPKTGGTLTGSLTAVSITVGGQFNGSGAGIDSIPAASLMGTVDRTKLPYANVVSGEAGIVILSNVTDVATNGGSVPNHFAASTWALNSVRAGALSVTGGTINGALTVTGALSAGTLSGNGAGLTNVPFYRTFGQAAGDVLSAVINIGYQPDHLSIGGTRGVSNATYQSGTPFVLAGDDAPTRGRDPQDPTNPARYFVKLRNTELEPNTTYILHGFWWENTTSMPTLGYFTKTAMLWITAVHSGAFVLRVNGVEVLRRTTSDEGTVDCVVVPIQPKYLSFEMWDLTTTGGVPPSEQRAQIVYQIAYHL